MTSPNIIYTISQNDFIAVTQSEVLIRNLREKKQMCEFRPLQHLEQSRMKWILCNKKCEAKFYHEIITKTVL